MGSGHLFGGSERVCSSIALPLIFEGLSELDQEGHATWCGIAIPVRDDDAGIYAVSPDQRDVVGVLVYRRDQVAKTVVIPLLYVEPSSRRCGAASAMVAHVLDQPENSGFTLHLVGVHASNRAAQELCRKLGLVEASASFELRPS